MRTTWRPSACTDATERLRPHPSTRLAGPVVPLGLPDLARALFAEPHPAKNGHRQAGLIHRGPLRLVLFAFEPGGTLPEHRAPGHVVIHNADLKIAFVGDVLFAGSIGRTDFPRGNHQQLVTSITTRLWPLGEDMRFVPGHGPMSTFGRERQANPFVADRLTGYGGAAQEAADAAAQRTSKRYT